MGKVVSSTASKMININKSNNRDYTDIDMNAEVSNQEESLEKFSNYDNLSGRIVDIDWKLSLVNDYGNVHQNKIVCLIETNDGNTIYTSSYDGTIKEWNTQTDKLIHTYQPNITQYIYGARQIRCIALTKCEKFLFSGGEDGRLRQWSTKKSKLLQKDFGRTNRLSILCMQVSVDGRS